MALFTSESAKLASAKSVQTRKAKAAAKAAAKLNPEPAPVNNEVANDNYREIRLARVRSQLDRIDNMLAFEADADALIDLARCSAVLEEQERRLSGRSLPPTLKAPARQRSKSSAPAPLDE